MKGIRTSMAVALACLLVAGCDMTETDLDRCELQLVNAAERLVESLQQEITFSCGAKLPEPYIIVAADGPVEKEVLLAAGVEAEDALVLAGLGPSRPGRSFMLFKWGTESRSIEPLRVPVVGHLIAIKKPLEKATFTIRKRGQMLEIVDLK
jgi:hypothetical protein